MAKRASIKSASASLAFLINTPSATPPADWAAVFVTSMPNATLFRVLPTSSLLKAFVCRPILLPTLPRPLVIRCIPWVKSLLPFCANCFSTLGTNFLIVSPIILLSALPSFAAAPFPTTATTTMTATIAIAATIAPTMLPAISAVFLSTPNPSSALVIALPISSINGFSTCSIIGFSAC
ncbi:Uncharacterised protein [Salmonella enterica subsp. enterica serovar Bovismorbificans]|uniref:Uncharacterized protein n=1 Tax=Salmonella enterica subsp. enterica serovar Bovismorbificans TaxID=58097 RepID=A0A655CGI0_SALET|nr:Uncharacterised protein [Salmonella enterica subsp. enterica serovar Bovismorbificans]